MQLSLMKKESTTHCKFFRTAMRPCPGPKDGKRMTEKPTKRSVVPENTRSGDREEYTRQEYAVERAVWQYGQCAGIRYEVPWYGSGPVEGTAEPTSSILHNFIARDWQRFRGR